MALKFATNECGRIIRGKVPSDFLTLTDDPTRLIVMTMGPDGLAQIDGKSGYESLEIIGYEPNYIVTKVNEGNLFKLVTFPEGKDALLATWDNVLVMVQRVYPEVAYMVENNLSELKKTTFDTIEARAGFDFSEVDKLGSSDYRYMTYDRFEKSGGDLIDTRAFLYFTLHLRELFSGDGYTYTSNGVRGLKEYFIQNMPIADISGAKVYDIDVELPKTNYNMRGATFMNKSNLVTPFEKIVDVTKIATKQEGVTIPEILNLANGEKLKPAVEDVKTRLLLVIDPENDFMPDIGTLSVPGAREDIKRLAWFIYNNMDNITKIMGSMDIHSYAQIFHPSWWIDKNGNNPPPFTTITVKDYEEGIWTPVYETTDSINYLKGLEAGGKKSLCIWPYHCLENTFGAQIETQLMNMIYFHSVSRKTKPSFIHKGQKARTEMYGIIKAEFDPGNGAFLNTVVLKAIEDYDEIFIAGEAKSHCVLESVKQILEHYNTRPEITRKITILEDCTSCIPGCEADTEKEFVDFKRQYGIQIKASTEV